MLVTLVSASAGQAIDSVKGQGGYRAEAVIAILAGAKEETIRPRIARALTHERVPRKIYSPLFPQLGYLSRKYCEQVVRKIQSLRSKAQESLQSG